MAATMKVTRLQAKLVTLSNDVTQVVSSKVVDVSGSWQANTFALAEDLESDTHTSVLEYYIGYSYAAEDYIINTKLTVKAINFVKSVEPTLVWENNDAESDGA